MAEDKAGKATAHNREMTCSDCGRGIYVKYDKEIGWYYEHPANDYCPASRKRFKVKTVELEEL
jgi:hypothetical protein